MSHESANIAHKLSKISQGNQFWMVHICIWNLNGCDMHKHICINKNYYGATYLPSFNMHCGSKCIYTWLRQSFAHWKWETLYQYLYLLVCAMLTCSFLWAYKFSLIPCTAYLCFIIIWFLSFDFAGGLKQRFPECKLSLNN